jgi:hypothetical protein
MINSEKKRKEDFNVKTQSTLNDLSELEEETFNFIQEEGKVGIKQIQEANPRMLGALGKLKSKGLIEFERVYKQVDYYHKVGNKLVKIKEHPSRE